MKESATPCGRGRLGATVYRLGRCGRLVAWQAAARGSGLQGHRGTLCPDRSSAAQSRSGGDLHAQQVDFSSSECCKHPKFLEGLSWHRGGIPLESAKGLRVKTQPQEHRENRHSLAKQ